MRSWLAGFLAAAIAVVVGTHAASAATVTPIYSFCSVQKCADGAEPTSPLSIDAQGAIYGTTQMLSEGTSVLYKLIPLAKGGYKYKKLHTFCYTDQDKCPSGSDPTGRLVLDPAGNIYGIATSGGFNHSGVVYRVAPSGKYKVVYKFCRRSCDATGASPIDGLTYFGAESGLPYDGTSPLYGTTSPSGSNGGMVFRLAQSGGNLQFTGLAPLAGQTLIFITSPDGSDFFLQITSGGLYELSPAGADHLSAKLLLTFCQNQCKEGSNPASLTVDPATGNLFGTTTLNSEDKHGAVWEAKAPDYSSFIEVHPFCSVKPACADGQAPTYFSMGAMDTAGVYATTQGGGHDVVEPPLNSGGTLYRAATNGLFTALYQFCSQTNCTDGVLPVVGLTSDGHGHYFGTTQWGGSGQFGSNQQNPISTGGMVYEFTP